MFNDNITIFGNIMVTENYDMFKKIGGNRKINKANYSKIVKSMKEEQLIIPIVVNEKYEIIDGQHRFTACKDLGKPVYFYMVRGYGLEQVKRANIASSNWKKENYLDMFIAEKNEVAVVENIPLARALYAAVEVGMEIPKEFYNPVAEILAHIYSKNKKDLN